ncbi:DMT family transporter [Candidatus Nephthysia bennettiae]|uniref:DMT family transporter n=1 Tax=Candidatus Nephthysia bennettiae TaxID=3127016 RepID=A0A934K9C6_9BACT|nr:DMT family transporter [Candidatus Dormibacteraeota bacterium]
MKRSDVMMYVLLAAGAASGGGAFVVGKVAVADLPAATVALLRYGIAVILFAALLLAERRPLPRPSPRQWLLLTGMGLSAVAGYNLVFLEALKRAPAAEGGLIVPGSAPILFVALSALVFRQLPSRRTMLGVAMATAGLGVLFASSGGLADCNPSHRLGELLYLAGGFCWAVFLLCAHGLHGRIPSLAANTYAAVIGLAILAPLAILPDRGASLAHVRLSGAVEAAYLAVFATVLLLWANVRGLERLGAERVAPFVYIAPIAAVLGAAVFLGERPSPIEIVGGAIALLGTWVATHRPAPAAIPAATESRAAAA